MIHLFAIRGRSYLVVGHVLVFVDWWNDLSYRCLKGNVMRSVE